MINNNNNNNNNDDISNVLDNYKDVKVINL